MAEDIRLSEVNPEPLEGSAPPQEKPQDKPADIYDALITFGIDGPAVVLDNVENPDQEPVTNADLSAYQDTRQDDQDAAAEVALTNVVLSGLSPDKKQVAIDAVTAEKVRPPSKRELALDTVGNQVADEREQAGDTLGSAFVRGYVQNRREVDAGAEMQVVIGNSIAEMTGSDKVLRSWGDGLESFFDTWTGSFTFAQQAAMSNVIGTTFGIDVGLGDKVSTTGIMKKARAAYADATPEERRKMVERLPGALATMQYGLGNNQLLASEAMDVFQAITGDSRQYQEGLESTHQSDQIEWVMALPIIFTAGALGSVRTVIKQARRIRNTNSFVQDLSVIDQPAAAEALARALDEPTGEAATALKTTKEELINQTVVPKAPGDDVLPRPGLNARIAEEITPEEIQELEFNRFLNSPEELVKEKERIGKTMARRKDKKRGNLVSTIAQTEVVEDEATGVLKASFALQRRDKRHVKEFDGATTTIDEDKPWDNYKEVVRDVANYLRPEEMEGLSIWKLGDDGLYKKLDQADDAPFGNYIARVDISRKPTEVGIVQESMYDRLGGELGSRITSAFDTTVTMAKRFSDSTSNLAFQVARVEKRLSGILEPASGLKRKEMGEVMSYLKRSEESGVTPSIGDLRRDLPNEKSVKAYVAVRQFYDSVHTIRDLHLRDYLKRGRYMTIGEGDKAIIARKVKDERAGEAITAYHPDSGKVLRLDQMKGKENYELWEMPSDALVNGKQTKFVLRRIGEDPKPLPSQVLKYEANYLGRDYRTKYIVEKEVTRVVNGVPTKVKEAVATADDVVDANRFKNAADNPEKLTIRRARETASEEVIDEEQELKLMADLNMIGHSQARKEVALEDASGGVSLLDIGESIEKTRVSVARTVGTRQWQQRMIDRWNAQFGQKFGENGRMPIGKLKPPMNVEDTKDFTEARALKNKIDLVMGTSRGTLSKRYQDLMLSLSERLAATQQLGWKRGLLERMSKLAAKASENSPDLLLREVNFMRHIILQPNRQFGMQMSQAILYSALDGGSKYYATGKAALDTVFINAAMSLKDVSPKLLDKVVARYAKARGVPEVSARRLFQDFQDSSIMEAVHSHQYIGLSGMGDTRVGLSAPVVGAWDSAKRGVRGVAEVAGKGFELGEGQNQLAAWLSVRNRYFQKRGLPDSHVLTRKEKDMLGVEARQVSGNMDSYNKMWWQSGAIGVPFQFMSHTVKMMNLLLPYKLGGSKVLTAAEKFRMGLYSSAIFGQKGWGMRNIVAESLEKRGYEVDDELKLALDQGLAGVAIHELVKSLDTEWDEESQINFSGTFGPFNGFTTSMGLEDRPSTPAGWFVDRMQEAIAGDPIGWESILGATAGTGTAVQRISSRLADIYAGKGAPPADRLGASFEVLARILPIYDNVVQARMAAGTGYWLTQQQMDKVVPASTGEVWAKAFFGINPKESGDVQDLAAMNRADITTKGPAELGELRRAGRDTLKAIERQVKLLNNGEFNLKQFEEYAKLTFQALRAAYPNEQQYTVVMKAYQEAYRDSMKDSPTKRESVLGKLMTDPDIRVEMEYNLGTDGLLARVKSLKPSPQRDAAIQVIQQMDELSGK